MKTENDIDALRAKLFPFLTKKDWEEIFSHCAELKNSIHLKKLEA